MISVKSKYFSVCAFVFKLLLLTIFCFLTINCQQKDAKQSVPRQNPVSTAENAININTASAQELEKLPNIGAKLAKKIIEHRERYGNFRKPEHLILVSGVSDRRFREMKNLIKVE